MALDLVSLESFVVVAENLSFSKAAERRHTVQSAVSAHIAKLEATLGVILFDRGRGQRVQLTTEGEVFLSHARRILNLSSEAIDAVRVAKTQPTIRLSTTVTLALSIIPKALSKFSESYPEVQIQISCDRSDALIRQFDAGLCDIAFMMDQGKRSSRVFVENSPLSWVSGPEFELDLSADIPLAFLTDGRDLRRFALEALDRVGRRGVITYTSPHPVGVRAFLCANLALSVMPRIAINSPLSIRGAEEHLPRLKNVAHSLYQQPHVSGPEVEALSSIVHILAKERSLL